MDTFKLAVEARTQLPWASEYGIQAYIDLLKAINDLSTIKSFKVNINLSNDPKAMESNITIIKFDTLPDKADLESTIYHLTDEAPDVEYFHNHDLAVISFDF